MTLSAGTSRRGSLTLFGVVLVAVVGLTPGLVIGPSPDAAVFTLFGQRLLHGVPPYSGTWDHKPPGVFLLSAAAQALVPWAQPWLAVWAITAICTGLTLVLILVILRTARARRPALLSMLAAVALSAYPLSMGGGLTESIAILPATAAYWQSGRRTRWSPFLSGTLIGLAACVSLLALAATPAALLRLRRPAGRMAENVGVMLWFLSGVAVVSIVAVLALLTLGAGWAAWEALITYNSVYGRTSRALGADVTILPGLMEVLPAVLPLVLCAGIALRSRDAIAKSLPALSWIGALAVGISLIGRVEPHYGLLLIPPLAIAACGKGGRINGERKLLGSGRLARFESLLLVPLSVMLWVMSGAPPASIAYASGAHSRAVSAFIDATTSGSATMFVWGLETRLYLDAGRSPEGPYVYAYPLMTPGYSTEAQVEQLVLTFAQRPPTVIVDAGSPAPGQPGIVPLLISRPIQLVEGRDIDGRHLDVLPPLREFIKKRYCLLQVVEGWPVYVLCETHPAT